MKTGFLKRKTICKNEVKTVLKNYIWKNRRQKPFIIAFWSRFRSRYCDKEGSHDVGIYSHKSGGGNDALCPPRQPCVQASDIDFSGG